VSEPAVIRRPIRATGRPDLHAVVGHPAPGEVCDAPAQRGASRAALINRLRAARSCSLAALVAPAGYGTTTLLEQWAARDDRAFAWLPVGSEDDDPVAFASRIES
jgi:LuxR family maltose regulon positive regulatory protein